MALKVIPRGWRLVLGVNPEVEERLIDSKMVNSWFIFLLQETSCRSLEFLHRAYKMTSKSPHSHTQGSLKVTQGYPQSDLKGTHQVNPDYCHCYPASTSKIIPEFPKSDHRVTTKLLQGTHKFFPMYPQSDPRVPSKWPQCTFKISDN